ncbi:MAG: Hint domain-containing protein [Acetobacteraceae bacterium]|nr:Hint domain-containing protein [Acetobacteraceae bacterium]
MPQPQSNSATFQFSHTLPGGKLFDWSSSANWVNGVTPGSLGGTAAVTIPASSAGTSYDNIASLTLASLNDQTGAPAVEIGSGDTLVTGTIGPVGVVRVDANAKLLETGGAGGAYITLNGANAITELNGNPSAALTFTAGNPSGVYLRQIPLGASDTHPVQGFAAGNHIYLEEQGWKAAPTGPFSATYVPNAPKAATGTLTITSGGTTVYKLTNFTGNQNSAYRATATTITDPQTGASVPALDLTVVCFAEGTRIATPDGARLVEALRVGDLVTAVEAGQHRPRRVRWVGRRRLDLAAHPRPECAAPVRFRAGALSEGLPCRDLLVSPDHALLLGGRLVPAKLLLNGMTIVQERALPAVSYYHVELDEHAILLAEGVAAESYLEQGHRGFFANGGPALELFPDLTARPVPLQEAAACAPYARGISEVEPIWRALAEHARALGYVAPACALTTDPDLCVLADGEMVPPHAIADGRFGFAVPANTRSLRLVSRSFVPAERTPYVDDWRRLGVAVSAIALRTASGFQDIALDQPAFARGWHAAERQGALLWRWTDGDAVLPLACAEGGVLEVRVHATGAYQVAEIAAEGMLAA